MKKRVLGFLTAFIIAFALFSPPVTELLGGRYAAVSAAETGLLEDYASKYYYSLLTDDQKAVYGLLFNGIKNSESSIDISEYNLNDSTLGTVMTLLKYENPQLFNADGSATGTGDTSTRNWLTVNPTYTRSAAQVKSITAQLEEAAAEIIGEALKQTDSFKQIKVLHDSIVNMTTYTLSGPAYKSEADGPLVNGKALCEGYSKAFAYLCQSMGYPCICIVGSGNGENHMWNMVKVDGKWYHVDVTWDDPISSQPVLRYDYFLVSTATIRKDHSISNPAAIPTADTDYDESMSAAAENTQESQKPKPPEEPEVPDTPDTPDTPEIPDEVYEPVLSENVPIDMNFSWLTDPNSNISLVTPLFYYTSRIPQEVTALVGGTFAAGFDIGNIGMRSQLIYNAGAVDTGRFATLLCYNDSLNKAEFVSWAEIDGSGKAALDVYGAGRYFVVIDRTAKIPGDVSGNRSINAIDAALILKSLTNDMPLDPFIADYNGDGRVNAIDAAAILAYAAA